MPDTQINNRPGKESQDNNAALAFTSHGNVVKLHHCVALAFQSHSFCVLATRVQQVPGFSQLRECLGVFFSLLVFPGSKQRN